MADYIKVRILCFSCKQHKLIFHILFISLQKHDAPEDVFEFERLVLYPLILKPRAEPYQAKKLRKNEAFSPLCGTCIANVDGDQKDQPASALPNGNNSGDQDHAPSGLALTPSSLQRAGAGLHSFFHDRGFHHMRAGKHERAMSDAMSSGGGTFFPCLSVKSESDVAHLAHWLKSLLLIVVFSLSRFANQRRRPPPHLTSRTQS